MSSQLGLALFGCCALAFLCPVESIVFSAFNIKWLTLIKYNKPIVKEILPEILKLYDVTLIQEIRAKDEDILPLMTAMLDDLHSLLDFYDFLSLNTPLLDVGSYPNSVSNHTYDYVLSRKMGRTRYKERYAFLFRQGTDMNVTLAQEYDDPLDVFERDPYMALVSTPNLDFGIVGCHVKPADTVNELNNLTVVYDYAVTNLGTENILFAGDFNADCSYLSNAKYDKLTFSRESDKFQWLIGKLADTTVSTNTNCAYDRFVTSGTLLQHVVNGSVSILNYQSYFSLTDDEAKIVTDHYPISVELK